MSGQPTRLHWWSALVGLLFAGALGLAQALEPDSELVQQMLAERKQRLESSLAQLDERIASGKAEGERLAWLYRERGVVRSHLTQYAEALADLDRAIELSQVQPQFYEDRAITYLRLREFKAANDDLDMALGLDSRRASSFREKGRLASYQGDYDRAAMEFERALRNAQNEAIVYGSMWLEVALRRAKREGDSGIAQVLPQIDPRQWPAPLLQMFAGKLTPAQAIAAAAVEDPRQTLLRQCEAFFYAGQKYLIDGERDQARAAFEAAVATGIAEFLEYDWSVRELESMGK